jgi:Ring finger domain
MSPQIKVGKCSVKIWWIIFLCLQLFLLALMITTCAVSPWVTSKFDLYITYFNGAIFKGDISGCVAGCDCGYSDCESNWCELPPYGQEYTFESLCLLFKSLQKASTAFVVCEIFSMIGILMWTIGMARFLLKYISGTYCCPVCAFIFHLIGILVWIQITQASFSGSCGIFPRDGKYPIVCASAGPILGVFVLCIMPIIVVLYLVVTRKAYNKERLEHPQRHEIDIQINHSVVNSSNRARRERVPYNPERHMENSIPNQNSGIENFYNDEIGHISIPPADELNNHIYLEPPEHILQSEPIRMDESNFEEITLTILPNDQGLYVGHLICLLCAARFTTEVEVRLLPCGHPFHTNCILENIIRKDRKICPNCNQKYS